MELGINATATGWFGVVGPKGMPPAMVTRLNQLSNDFLTSAEGKAQLEKLAVGPIGGPPDALGKFVASEMAKWGPIIAPIATAVMN